MSISLGKWLSSFIFRQQPRRGWLSRIWCCTRIRTHLFSSSIAENVKLLIDRPDGTYCFRLHRDRVYYVSETIMKIANNVSRDNLLSMGTCFGKFTKTGKFHLHITALDYLAPYAKVCLCCYLKGGCRKRTSGRLDNAIPIFSDLKKWERRRLRRDDSGAPLYWHRNRKKATMQNAAR